MPGTASRLTCRPWRGRRTSHRPTSAASSMPYGIDAPFRDPFGNEFRMVQTIDEGEA